MSKALWNEGGQGIAQSFRQRKERGKTRSYKGSRTTWKRRTQKEMKDRTESQKTGMKSWGENKRKRSPKKAPNMGGLAKVEEKKILFSSPTLNRVGGKKQ